MRLLPVKRDCPRRAKTQPIRKYPEVELPLLWTKVVIQLSSVENAGRCPRCGTFITSEQVASHDCHIPIKSANTIFLDWMGDGFTDENGDYVRMAQGLNGTLYSMILCKHNPPHSTKRKFTDYDAKQGLDRASEEVLLRLRDTPRIRLSVARRDIVFFPLLLYIIMFGLAWLLWSRNHLDRKDALFVYLLSIGVAWIGLLTNLALNQEYASSYGIYLLEIGAVFSIVGGTAGVLAYRYWPISTTVSDEVPTTLELERTFFRNQVFGEFVSILSQLRSPILVVRIIAYSVWRNRPDYLKIQLLGADDYSKLDAFYRRVDERNRFYEHAIPEALQDVAYDESRREIIENARRLFEEIAWLRVRRDEVPWPTE
jgi:hypothetical protein